MTTQRIDGFAPINDYALLGDGRCTALVARDGSIDWFTSPSMASDPVLGAILDPERGGHFLLRPAADDYQVSRRYLPATGVLETTYRTAGGSARVVEGLMWGLRGQLPWIELARCIDGESGSVPMRWEFRGGTRFGSGSTWTHDDNGLPLLTCDDQFLMLLTDNAGEPEMVQHGYAGEFTIGEGEQALVGLISVDQEPIHLVDPGRVRAHLDQTIKIWQDWTKTIQYEGPWRKQIEASAIALSQLTYQFEAIQAAATTSLPERIGSSRNFDYRYSWIRDSTFSVDALLRLGLPEETHAGMSWLLNTVSKTAPDIRVCYDIHGNVMSAEQSPVWPLPGYRNSAPVMAGNQAASQRQLGSYGYLIDGVARFVRHGNVLDAATGRMLAELADHCAEQWQKKDAGLWELGDEQHYTATKINCWAAMHAAVELADAGAIPAVHREQWATTADQIHRWVDENCWSEDKQSYTFYAGTDDLDCATLLAARTGFCDPDDPRLSSTIDAIQRELMVKDTFVYRYSGMQEKEGAFLACCFWVVEAMAHAGRLDEAKDILQRLLDVGTDVALLSEEIDPGSEELLGNLPQALSHLALIGAVTALTDALDERDGGS